MMISTIAHHAGCSERAIRHYHRIGVLPEPERRSNGYRDYDISDLIRVLTIRALVGAGIPLAQVNSELDFDSALIHLDTKIAQLQQQRENLLRLRHNKLAPPAPLMQQLEEFLARQGLPQFLITYELEALGLMAICKVATDATWQQLSHNLSDPSVAEATASAAQLWQHMATLQPTSPEFEEIIINIAQLVPAGILKGLPATCIPGSMDIRPTDFALPHPYNHALIRLMEVINL